MMEIGSKHQRAKELKRVEAITVPNSDSAEQNELQPNPTDEHEVTTTPSNPTEDTRIEEPRLEKCTRQKEPSSEPQRQDLHSLPTKQAPTTLREEDIARITH